MTGCALLPPFRTAATVDATVIGRLGEDEMDDGGQS